MPSNHSHFQVGNPRERAAEGTPRHPEQVLLAEVRVIEGPHGPRSLVVCRHGSEIVVRRTDGRLLWLQTATTFAVRSAAHDSEIIEEENIPGRSSLLLPPDYGVEGIAVTSIDNFMDYFEAHEQFDRLGSGTSHTSLSTAPTSHLRCTIEGYGKCDIWEDPSTGFILEAKSISRDAHLAGQGENHESLSIRVDTLRELPLSDTLYWLQPQDL